MTISRQLGLIEKIQMEFFSETRHLRSLQDIAPKPAAGQSTLWKYKAIYRQGDDRVGQWSDVVSIPVAG